MAKILDQHHGALLCCQCQKYLSVFPVKVYDKNVVKCGRCCKPNDGGVVSLYEQLAGWCLFKCVNRYEGCRKFLLPSEVVEHEKTCIARNYKCPSCEINATMSALQLVQHFKHYHTDQFLSSNIIYFTFLRNISNETFLYIQDDNVFIIFVRYVPDHLYFSAVTLCELENVVQQFVVSMDASSFKQATRKRECVSLTNLNSSHYFKIKVSNILKQIVVFEIVLDLSETSVSSYEIQFSKENDTNKTVTKKQELELVSSSSNLSKPDLQQNTDHNPPVAIQECQPIPETKMNRVELTRKFRTQYPDYELTDDGTALYSRRLNKRFELTCSNCKALMGAKIFSCYNNSHMFCEDCGTWCGECNQYLGELVGVQKIQMLSSKYLLLSCKWECGAKYTPEDLKEHEMSCYEYNIKCPVCCNVVNINDLGGHLYREHLCTFRHKIKLCDFLYRNMHLSEDEYYFDICNKIFKIKLIEWVETYYRRSCPTRRLRITPCDDMTGLELFVIERAERGYKYHKLDNEITIHLYNNPTFYLKHLQ